MLYNTSLTSPSETETSGYRAIGFGEITFLLRWDWPGWWGDWWIRGPTRCLFTLSSIAIVSNTTFVGSTPDLNFTSISPIWSPGILDQPVVNSIFGAVSNYQDSVIDVLGSAG